MGYSLQAQESLSAAEAAKHARHELEGEEDKAKAMLVRRDTVYKNQSHVCILKNPAYSAFCNKMRWLFSQSCACGRDTPPERRRKSRLALTIIPEAVLVFPPRRKSLWLISPQSISVDPLTRPMLVVCLTVGVAVVDYLVPGMPHSPQSSL